MVYPGCVCKTGKSKNFMRSVRATGFAEALLPSYISVNQIFCMHVP